MGTFVKRDLCDPATDPATPVIVAIPVDDVGAPGTPVYTDPTGAAWAGDPTTLITCECACLGPACVQRCDSIPGEVFIIQNSTEVSLLAYDDLSTTTADIYDPLLGAGGTNNIYALAHDGTLLWAIAESITGFQSFLASWDGSSWTLGPNTDLASRTSISGATFCGGQLYLLKDGTQELVTVDTTTGVTTLVCDLSTLPDLEGLLSLACNSGAVHVFYENGVGDTVEVDATGCTFTVIFTYSGDSVSGAEYDPTLVTAAVTSGLILFESNTSQLSALGRASRILANPTASVTLNPPTQVPFLRCYEFDGLGGFTFSDFELDGTTPYVPVGEVVLCT